MKLHVFTIALDAMPFIGWHLPMLDQLQSDWHWTIAEGAAMNVRDTAWCRPQSPRLSVDGTTEYLESIRSHPRVTVLRRQAWDGKTDQCNACLETMQYPGLLLQIDADELWTAPQLEVMLNLFKTSVGIRSAQFFCRYRVGPNLSIVNTNCYGNGKWEWFRAWRFHPGMRFQAHEPPRMTTPSVPCATREETSNLGLVFDHWAYVLESQVRFKEQFYGYKDAVQHWRRLQANTKWPALLAGFLPWVKDGAVVDRIYR